MGRPNVKQFKMKTRTSHYVFRELIILSDQNWTRNVIINKSAAEI